MPHHKRTDDNNAAGLKKMQQIVMMDGTSYLEYD